MEDKDLDLVALVVVAEARRGLDRNLRSIVNETCLLCFTNTNNPCLGERSMERFLQLGRGIES